LYMMDEFYYPEAAKSIPYDSKDLNIKWPLQEKVHL
jgi:dTDP-4-dehydrorhamnose 3,5-epimerase-like enzyme